MKAEDFIIHIFFNREKLKLPQEVLKGREGVDLSGYGEVARELILEEW